MSSDGTETVARAASEVLLSGGVINSPQLLLLSGIGPADQLRAHGIDVVADVPGVGENLHDHTMVPLVWATQHSTDLLEMASPENMALWQGGHGGPFASNGGEVGGFVSTAGGDVPNVQLIGGPTAFVDHGRTSPPLPNFTMLTASTHPRSRGRLWLRSPDPLAHPHIDPAYFAHPDDLADITAGLRVSLEIANQSPISKYLRGLNASDGGWTRATQRSPNTRNVGRRPSTTLSEPVRWASTKTPSLTPIEGARRRWAACRRRIRDADRRQR